MVDKRVNTKTLMNAFFATVLIVVLGVFVFSAASFDGQPLTRGNYTQTILLNCSTSSEFIPTTAINANMSYYYNASDGPVTASADYLLVVQENQTDGDFNVTFDSSGLDDGTTYNISCYADNGTDQEWSSVFNVTIDNTPPAVNFSDTTSTALSTNDSIINNGNYSASDLVKGFNFNISFSDAIWNDSVLAGASIYINLTNSSGDQLNFTRAINETNNVFFNSTINMTNSTIYPDGKYNITIWANDSVYLVNSAGTVSANLNNSEYIQITIDRTSPSTPTLAQSSSTTSTSNVITITASDATSGIDNCVVSGSDITITGRGTGTQTLTHTGLNCGTSYSYIVQCFDQVGYSATTASTSFSTSSCSGGSSPAGGGGGTVSAIEKVNVFSTIMPDTPVTITGFEEGVGVESLEVSVKEEVSNVKVTVKKFDQEPSEITVSKSGNVHKYLQIESENLQGKLEGATLTIKVQKNWLLDNSIDKANIALFRLDESAGRWNELSTVYKSEDDNYYYYNAELEEFSYFAIAEKVTQEPEPEAGEKNLLWLWITIGVVVALIIIGGGFAAKKKRK